MAYRARAVLAEKPATAPISRSRLIDACRRGQLPAELLEQADREHLVYDLWADGWTDVEIAQHTFMTTYTTGRIRDRLGVPAHPSTRGADA
ncbi:hypothetical protein [Amycolatopsis sp. NPDC004378]